MKIAGTGHRPEKLGGYRVPNRVSDAIGALLRQYLTQERPDEVITGMALGFDQMLAWMALELNIPFAAYIPCDNFESRWPEQSREQYNYLLQHASRVQLCSPNQPYHASLMQVRNVRMVEDTDKVLALWNGSTGGTANCLRYARTVGKPIDYLPLPVEIWDQAREWEMASRSSRRGMAAPQPATRPVRHFRRPAGAQPVPPTLESLFPRVDPPDFTVTVTPVTPVSRPFDRTRPIVDVAGVPQDIVDSLQGELRVARTEEQRSRALRRYNRRRELYIRSLEVRPAPLLTETYPLPAPPPAELPEDERMRRIAEQLGENIDTDVLRALVNQNRHLLHPEKPETQMVSTDQHDRFTPRRKIDLDD